MAGRRLAVDALVRSWVRSMRARNLTETTITHYTSSVDQLLDHARSRGHDPLTRVAIEEYLGTLARERKPATVSFRYRALQQFTNWLAEEEELPADPMARMRPPQVPEQPVPVLTDDQMRALLGTCAKGKDFVDRRDHAIMRLFMDTGMRLAEMAGLHVEDVDLDVHRWRTSRARGAAIARAHSARRPPRHSIGTCASDPDTSSSTHRTCGSGRRTVRA